tara:strand:+ start:134 stop:325 length:192 start_codon:yes stop_codon:yes gene_type:complete
MDREDKKRELSWEITQLAVAIDYYEMAIGSSYSIREAEEYKAVVFNLNQQLKELEERRDLYQA